MKQITSLLLLGAICGCGEGSQSPEPVYPVSGVILLKGQPVVGADVTFMNSEKKRSAFGRTNEKGEYRLTTFASNDGAVEGQVVVTVSKTPPAADTAPVADIDSPDYQPPVVDFRPQAAAKKTKAKPELPERYASTATTTLIAMVAKDRENKLNFDLEL